jgi:hypothetical protein
MASVQAQTLSLSTNKAVLGLWYIGLTLDISAAVIATLCQLTTVLYPGRFTSDMSSRRKGRFVVVGICGGLSSAGLGVLSFITGLWFHVRQDLQLGIGVTIAVFFPSTSVLVLFFEPFRGWSRQR